MYELLSDPELLAVSIDNVKKHKSKDITSFEPYANNIRINNQKCVVIVFPDYTADNEKLELDEDFIDYEIIIKKNVKRKLVAYLENKGINSDYITVESDLTVKNEILKIINEFNEKLSKIL